MEDGWTTLICSAALHTPPSPLPSSSFTPDSLWEAVADRLRETLSETAWATWFGGARPLALTDASFTVGVPNDFTRNWIQGHFLELLRGAVADVAAGDLRIELEVDDAARQPHAEVSALPAEDARTVLSAASAEVAAPANPKYTFDNFVIGSSNRFAHAAALAVAETPAQGYNPLFIYGDTGLGKTHLLQAIVAYVSENSRLTTRYVTCEAFTNDFINSLGQRGRIEGFKQRYRAYDVLLVDDVQFLEGKDRIQEEFFHTFNSLHEAGKQVVLSCDRHPREIATLENRLRSRFEWGLMTDIQAPDVETRIAILRKKAAADGVLAADPAVLTFVASRVATNIRELEGALTRVVAFSSLTGLPLTVELAEQVLRDLFPEGGVPDVTISRIQEVVCERFGLTQAELVSARRNQALAYPRQVAMYLSREMTPASLPKIGREFGGRDHTTVMHATAKITRRISEDRSVYNLVQDLTARIKKR